MKLVASAGAVGAGWHVGEEAAKSQGKRGADDVQATVCTADAAHAQLPSLPAICADDGQVPSKALAKGKGKERGAKDKRRRVSDTDGEGGGFVGGEEEDDGGDESEDDEAVPAAAGGGRGRRRGRVSGGTQGEQPRRSRRLSGKDGEGEGEGADEDEDEGGGGPALRAPARVSVDGEGGTIDELTRMDDSEASEASGTDAGVEAVEAPSEESDAASTASTAELKRCVTADAADEDDAGASADAVAKAGVSASTTAANAKESSSTTRGAELAAKVMAKAVSSMYPSDAATGTADAPEGAGGAAAHQTQAEAKPRPVARMGGAVDARAGGSQPAGKPTSKPRNMPRTKVTKHKGKGAAGGGAGGKEATGMIRSVSVGSVALVQEARKTPFESGAAKTQGAGAGAGVSASAGAGAGAGAGAVKGPRGVTTMPSASSTSSSPHESEDEELLECRESLLLEGAPAEYDDDTVPEGIVDIDKGDPETDQAFALYGADYMKVYQAHLWADEDRCRPKLQDGYGAKPSVTSDMRKCLVDWLVDISEEFKVHEVRVSPLHPTSAHLVPPNPPHRTPCHLISPHLTLSHLISFVQATLFLGVSLLDRALDVLVVSRDKLQLLGCVCMLVAVSWVAAHTPQYARYTRYHTLHT